MVHWPDTDGQRENIERRTAFTGYRACSFASNIPKNLQSGSHPSFAECTSSRSKINTKIIYQLYFFLNLINSFYYYSLCRSVTAIDKHVIFSDDIQDRRPIFCEDSQYQWVYSIVVILLHSRSVCHTIK